MNLFKTTSILIFFVFVALNTSNFRVSGFLKPVGRNAYKKLRTNFDQGNLLFKGMIHSEKLTFNHESEIRATRFAQFEELTNRTDGISQRSATDASSIFHTTPINFLDITAGMEINTRLPPIIIIHGMFGSSKNFAGWGKGLYSVLSQPRRILSIDLPNHGKSGWKESMTYDGLAADISEFMSSQGIPTAVFVGHSLGGKVACAVALTQPEKIAGLVVLDIAPVCYTLEKDPQWKDVVTWLLALNALPLSTVTNRAHADSLLAPVIPNESKRAFCLSALQPDPTTKQLKWQLNIRALVNNLDTLAAFDLPQSPESAYGSQLSYNGDALFVAGGKSRFLRSSHLSTIAALFPRYALTSVREAGHWLHVEAAEQTQALIKAYLER